MPGVGAVPGRRLGESNDDGSNGGGRRASAFGVVDQFEAVGDGADGRDHVMAHTAAQQRRKVEIGEEENRRLPALFTN